MQLRIRNIECLMCLYISEMIISLKNHWKKIINGLINLI